MTESSPPSLLTQDITIQVFRGAENGWNPCNPELILQAYAPDGDRAEIVSFLTRKWTRELSYRLIKELWTFIGNRIAVRF